MSDKFLPKFHITGEKGWINDPNGLIVFRGEYHAFYQYYPDGCEWGPMHWGHVKSRDLTHWERLPIALFPDADEDGCFSGSAIVHNDRLWLLYTGYKENGGKEEVRQLQRLASSDDGIHFIKHGTVIGEDDLPPEYCPWDFRDPKVFKRGDRFYCVVAALRRGGRGRILLYESADLFKWKFCCDVTGEDCGGIMTECPDFVDGVDVLTYCEQFQPAAPKKHLNIHSTFYKLGKLDPVKGFTADGGEDTLDYGFDFYAQQTFCGTPVMMGWLNMWKRDNPSEKHGFAGQLTVARKLSRRDGRLWQTPVFAGRETARGSISGSFTDTLAAGSIRLAIASPRAVDIKIGVSGDKYTSLRLVGDEWVFDRSRSAEKIGGFETDADSRAGIRRMPYLGGDTELEIVVDRYSVEVFADGMSMSSVVYHAGDGLEINIDADKCEYVKTEVE